MTAPARQPSAIWPWLSICGWVSDFAWRQAIADGSNVGVCGACGEELAPREPDTTNRRRVAYPAACTACGHDVVAYGPPPPKKDPPDRPRSTARSKH